MKRKNIQIVRDYAVARAEYKRLFQMQHDLMCEYVKLRENEDDKCKKYAADLAFFIDSIREDYSKAIKNLDTTQKRYNNVLFLATNEELKELLSEVTILIDEVNKNIESLKIVKESINSNGRKSLAAKEYINEMISSMKRSKESCIERKKEIKFTLESTVEKTKRGK